MRNPGTITVNAGIVHLVRRAKSGAGPFYSQAALDLAKHERIATFFSSHIHNSLTHQQAQTALFDRGEPDAVVYKNARAVLCENQSLVRPSMVIAKHLQATIEKLPSASESALACCIYSDENEQNARFLAVLKLEPGGAFRPKPAKDKSGRAVVLLEELNDILPSEREQLQKAALIRTPVDGKPTPGAYDMMLLDRQTRGSHELANYFMKFLDAHVSLDPHSATWLLINTWRTVVREVGNLLSPEETETLLDTLRVGITSERVEPTALAENLRIANGDVKRKIVDKVRAAIPDYAFTPDPGVVARHMKFRRFIADNDIRLTIDAEATKDDNIFKTSREGDLTIVTLRTRGWHEVSR